MIAIDTNIFVRILVDDPTAPEQCQLARQLVEQAAFIWISQIVLVETVWVLERAYRFDRSSILIVLDKINKNPAIRVEFPNRLKEAYALYENHHADFSDCLILSGVLEQQLIVHTFDRKLARLKGAQLLQSF